MENFQIVSAKTIRHLQKEESTVNPQTTINEIKNESQSRYIIVVETIPGNINSLSLIYV